jgi:hypothetical protein
MFDIFSKESVEMTKFSNLDLLPLFSKRNEIEEKGFPPLKLMTVL